MKEYRLTISGKPIAKARPRVGKFGTYTPKETVEYENFVAQCWVAQYGDVRPTDKPIHAGLTFYMPIPKSAAKQVKTAMLAGEVRHTKKPDLDNMAKAVLDALNGVAYVDDSQIYSVGLWKGYSDRPRTEVLIVESE